MEEIDRVEGVGEGLFFKIGGAPRRGFFLRLRGGSENQGENPRGRSSGKRQLAFRSESFEKGPFFLRPGFRERSRALLQDGARRRPRGNGLSRGGIPGSGHLSAFRRPRENGETEAPRVLHGGARDDTAFRPGLPLSLRRQAAGNGSELPRRLRFQGRRRENYFGEENRTRRGPPRHGQRKAGGSFSRRGRGRRVSSGEGGTFSAGSTRARKSAASRPEVPMCSRPPGR